MFFYTILPKVLNMSLTASVAIVFVLILRLLLKKAPKVISYTLWSVVLFRLLCPVSIESAVSLFGLLDTPVSGDGTVASSIEYIPVDLVHTEYPSVKLPIPGIGQAISNTFAQGEEQLVADPLEAPMSIATYIWLAGILAMGLCAAGSYLRLRRKLVTASRLRDHIYLADEISSPFVLGLLHPRIYLPSCLEEREQAYIIMHEQHHIQRFDHIIKALAFAALCIHWFNPLVWTAFMMSGKDMEMSCDEAVVKKMGDGVLADYAASLLSLATGRHIIAGMPLAFGEGDPKGRIRNLANWKKPAVWVILAAAAAGALCSICLLTNPKIQSLPFELKSIQISWSETLDCRPNEPTSFPLNQGELEELQSRLADLKVGKQDDDLAGFTPYYSISVQADGNHFSLQGFDLEGEHIALYFQGKYYRIQDSGFSQYLRNTCAGGARAAATETAPAAQEWFDYYKNGGMQWDGYKEIKLDAFPGVTFCWTPEKLEAIVGDETVPLYTGMPIWSVFFADLTGDGLPELCSTLTIGSGIGDNRVIIYDYANRASYSLEDRMKYDYSLSMQDGQLIVTKQVFSYTKDGDVVETGYLAYLNDTIQLVPYDPASRELAPGERDPLETAVMAAILEHNQSSQGENLIRCASFVTLQQELLAFDSDPPLPNQVSLYGMAMYVGFELDAVTGRLKEVEGSHCPVALSFEESGDRYTLQEYWMPRDGSDFIQDIADKFPAEAAQKAMAPQNYVVMQMQECYDQAVYYAGVETDFVIGQLFAEMESSSVASSSPEEYVDAHPMEYRELLYYGNHTLQYIFTGFMEGGQTGLHGQLMRIVLDALAPEARLKLQAENGQAYFDQWKSAAIQASKEHRMDWLKENQPAMYLLLHMTGAAEDEGTE